MSDQISEKMARKYYAAGTSGEWSELEDEFIENLKRKGLIKKSALEEAREWVKQKSIYPTEPNNSSWEVGYVVGVRDTAERFEAAITEILEEQNGPR